MAKKNKNNKNNKKVFFLLLYLSISVMLILGVYLFHYKSTVIENNFNSYLNRNILPMAFLEKEEENSTIPSLGFISKSKISCSTYPTFSGVKTFCDLEKGSVSILNYKKRKQVYFPIFTFSNIMAVVKTPLFSNKVFDKFDIDFKVNNINFDDVVLNNNLTMNSNKIKELLLYDEKEMADYNKTKNNVFSLFKDLTLDININGNKFNQKRFDVSYVFDLFSSKIHYKNEATFSIVYTKEEDVSLEYKEGTFAKQGLGYIKEGSFKSPGIDILSYADKSYLYFSERSYLKNIVYDFYKLNYLSSENKIQHNLFYLNRENDILFEKEEVLTLIKPLLEDLYIRVKTSPYGIFAKSLILTIKDNKANGVFIYKRLKKGKRPLAHIVDGVRMKYNFEKYFEEINDRYTLKEEICYSVEDCIEKYKNNK